MANYFTILSSPSFNRFKTFFLLPNHILLKKYIIYSQNISAIHKSFNKKNAFKILKKNFLETNQPKSVSAKLKLRLLYPFFSKNKQSFQNSLLFHHTFQFFPSFFFFSLKHLPNKSHFYLFFTFSNFHLHQSQTKKEEVHFYIKIS